MNDIERAISDISDIRSRLAASTRFHGYAPEAVVTIGLVSLAILLAQIAWPESLAVSNVQISMIWGGVLLTSALTIAIEAVTRTRRQHSGMAAAMLRGAMFTAMPINVTGIVTGAAIILYVPEAAWILPGFWQMLVGVVAFSSHSTLPRGIIWPGVWYVLCGAIVTMSTAPTGHISPVLAGAPFVVGHLWIARILYREGVESA